MPRKFTKVAQVERLVGKVSYQLDMPALTDGLSTPIWNFLDRGGKRWRPLLTLLVAEAYGTPKEDVIPIAIS